MSANQESGRRTGTVARSASGSGPPPREAGSSAPPHGTAAPGHSDTGPSDGAASGGPSHAERKFLGKYKIERTLGAGGMGAVYLATDMELRRQVALKILPRDKAENPRLVKRFKVEAQAAAQLRHDNIVAVYEAGEADGQLFIAQEFVDGIDAHQLMAKRGVVPAKRALDIVTQVARALEHAWEKRIVHRDIKPSNLLIRKDGVVKLADLGLARSIDETLETNITRAGTTVGTVDYMAPEQARDSKSADVRSDIYSLGCTWYHLLTGVAPFPDGSLTNKLHAHATRSPPDPRAINDSIPDAAVAVLHRMMAKKPDDRHQTPAELLEDLGKAAHGRENVTDALLAALAEDSPSPAPRSKREGPDGPGSHILKGSSGKSSREKTVSDSDDGAPIPLSRKSAAVATDDAPARSAERDGKASASRSGTKPKPALPPKSDPERKKRSLEDVQEDAGGVDLEPVKTAGKYAAAAVTAIAVLGLIWFITARVASVLDSGGPVKKTNPFEGDVAQTNVSVPGDPDDPAAAATDPKNPTSNPRDRLTPRPEDSGDGSDPSGPRNPSGSNPSQTVAFPTADPAESNLRVTIGREGERDRIPRWTAALPTVEDVSSQKNLGTLSTITVGRAGGKPADHATLASALEAVPRSGAVVKLIGDGPFVLKAAELSVRGRLIITASSGSHPVIILQPDKAGEGRRGLRAANMSLELVGVHLVAVARHFPADGEITLIEASTCDLTIRQGSITLVGTRPAPVTAIRVTGDAVRPGRAPLNSTRVLLDRVLVRGAGMTGLSLAQMSTDLVLSQCAFLTGDGPALRLQEPPVSSVGAAAPASKPEPTVQGDERRERRSVRMMSCTVSGSKTAFDFRPVNRSVPIPPTDVLLMNSVVAADTTERDATLLELGAWPAAVNPPRDRPLVSGLQWELVSSLCAGWDRLISADADAIRPAGGVSGWQQVWRTDVAAASFTSHSWPGQAFSSIGAAGPKDLAAVPLPAGTPDGSAPPGCDPALLTIPAEEYVARAEALADRPVERPLVPPPSKGEPTVVLIDASKQDAGKTISTGNWPSGATIRISGSGTQKSSPILIDGRSARIEFLPSDDAPLVLEARDSDYRAGAEAFVNVSRGGVEIVGGRFRIQSSSRGDVPKWFLSAADASFLLDSCSVTGPMLSGPRFESLVRWARGANEGNALPAGHYARRGRIANSYLCGFGKGIVADARGAGLSIDNSAIAVLGDLFDLDLSGADPKVPGAISLSRSTLSSPTAFFRVRGAALLQSASRPVRLFADDTAFVAAVDGGTGSPQKPLFLDYTGHVRTQGQLDWWGDGNGYCDELRVFLRGEEDSAPEPQSLDKHWTDAWGPRHELRPLSSKGGVLTTGGYKAKTKIVPSDFTIAPASPAGKWRVDGAPIGADVAALDEPDASKSSAGKTTGKKDSTKPTTIRPNF